MDTMGGTATTSTGPWQGRHTGGKGSQPIDRSAQLGALQRQRQRNKWTKDTDSAYSIIAQGNVRHVRKATQQQTQTQTRARGTAADKTASRPEPI